MPLIKTPEEIKKLKRGGAILSQTLRKVMDNCKVGVSTEELEKIVRQEFEKVGGKPSFLGYKISPRDPAYPCALCISINDEVVHGMSLPGRIIKEGDIVGLDIGLWYEGMATDMASTVVVGEVGPEIHGLVEATKESLKRGLSVVKEGANVEDIGVAIEEFISPKGYGIVRDLSGHGVGHAVHEAPSIPNYKERRAQKFALQEGMILAIEPMITLGTWKIKIKDDGWTIVTEDGSPAAHFEVTVAVTKDGYELITPWP
ncbi:MAG: type I methionyl aminopeptidase [Patescibacteria group bacterium]|nr:type I methionyl aminopeptidase [Patescibacteria group bacterium]MBU2509134.1 type I methionyl aminopeptidase [Patescibacteria group bacterium]